MNPELSNFALVVLGILVSAFVSVTTSWLMAKSAAKRVSSQNFHEDVDTARIALEIAEKATARQLEQDKEIHSLKSILKDKHYRVIVEFTLGETPKVERAVIEAIRQSI